MTSVRRGAERAPAGADPRRRREEGRLPQRLRDDARGHAPARADDPVLVRRARRSSRSSIAAAIVRRSQTQRKKARRHQPGPRDPWLNEVAVALADLGLKEIARNTGAQLGGAPIDGDIGLEAERLTVYVTLFSDQRRARQAELGLRAKPEVRDAIVQGRDRDQDRGARRLRSQRTRRRRRRVPPRRGRPRRRPAGGAAAAVGPDAAADGSADCRLPPAAASPDPDVLEQLRKLGELRDAGVLTDAEFEAKKAELLGRI